MSWRYDITQDRMWLKVEDFDPADNDVPWPVFDTEPLGGGYELVEANPGTFHLNVCRSLVKHDLRNYGFWEGHITKLIKAHAVKRSTVVDVGANIGPHTLTMSKAVGPEGRVYAFEPLPSAYNELCANVSINPFATNVRAARTALGARHSIQSMVQTADATKSFLEGTDRSDARATTQPEGPVEVRTLDSYNLRNVSLIKIDVEGSEYGVLQGAIGTLQRERPVVLVEIVGGVLFERAKPQDRARIYKTVQLLESLGYFVVREYQWDWAAFPIETIS